MIIEKILHAKRIGPTLTPDRSRVLMRPFFPARKEISEKIIARVLAFTDEEAALLLEHVLGEFSDRHENVEKIFLKRYAQLRDSTADLKETSPVRQALIGSYFSLEYSPESAALFNPSIVLHPDQSDLLHGSIRIILSLRATGEGHISSITFRTGIISPRHRIILAPPVPVIAEPELEIVSGNGYEVRFNPESRISQRILFPTLPSQSNGIEDARFVRFQNTDGTITYYATYTAYNGKSTEPQLLETNDFSSFRFIPLNGPAVQNKGMALFPRKINGQFMMLSRQDDENIFLMHSDTIHTWKSPELLIEPSQPWEFMKIGTCGSPIETGAGWLVLSHGVGPMRKYCIGAFLLDLKDPSKVLGRTREPILSPNEAEREGYVPNVVYTCGAILHGRELVIPYAMSDYATSFAAVSLDELLKIME